MLNVIKSSWALLLGIMLLMVGNGVQGSLIGLRATAQGFSPLELSMVTSAYFIGFLGGSILAPEVIRKVGHVRVFAALASFISAVLILYPVFTYSWAWVIIRIILGFCFSGVYVTAESWLNNSSTNETRGKTLSFYFLIQMIGIVIGQGLLNVGEPQGYLLFIIASVLVSISFGPILLSVAPSPLFATTRKMGFIELYNRSPLGCVGMFILGGVFSAQFGMSSFYGIQIGLNVKEVSLFVASIFIGSMILQYPIGWISDRMDRRVLIVYVALLGFASAGVGWVFAPNFSALVVAAFFLGGASSPLNSLLLAYTNDYLEIDEMAAGSGGLIFIGGLGAVTGPFLTGWLFAFVGPSGFWIYIMAVFLCMVAYALYRTTKRATKYALSEDGFDQTSYVTVGFNSTTVAIEAAQEIYVDNIEEINRRTD